GASPGQVSVLLMGPSGQITVLTPTSVTGTSATVETTSLGTFEACVRSPSATASTLTASSGSTPANGTSTATITVTVLDANGSPLAGQTVIFSASGTNNTIAQSASTTDANGVVTGTLASTTAETKTVTA